MITQELACQSRAELILKSLARHRLVFVQMGEAFAPLRDGIIEALAGHSVDLEQLDRASVSDLPTERIILRNLEECTETSRPSLGSVREKVFGLLDSRKEVCLVSTSPRLAFTSVPGSSVIEDAALVTLPLLSRADVQFESSVKPPFGWKWPSVQFGELLDEGAYVRALAELGQGLIAALDHALFEVNPKGLDGLQFLSSREVEGLRGSGFVEFNSAGQVQLVDPASLPMLREALAAHISETVAPAEVLPRVSSGLWYIERSIRMATRAAAIAKYGPSWRSSVLGGLDAEVLRRAQLDTNVAAKSTSELRDPLEWLTLGELLEIVRSDKFRNLGIEPTIWRKLGEQLVPIRNRLAHVRMLKAGDDEMVSMWVSLIHARLGG